MNTFDDTNSDIINPNSRGKIADEKSHSSDTSTDHRHFSTTIRVGENRGDRSWKDFLLLLRLSRERERWLLTCGESDGRKNTEDRWDRSSVTVESLHHRFEENIPHRIGDSKVPVQLKNEKKGEMNWPIHNEMDHQGSEDDDPSPSPIGYHSTRRNTVRWSTRCHLQ